MKKAAFPSAPTSTSSSATRNASSSAPPSASVGGNKEQAAGILEISLATLYRKLDE